MQKEIANRSTSSSWTLQAVNRRCWKDGWWAKHLDPYGLFLFWMRQEAKERREVWEEAKAILVVKTTPWICPAEGFKGCRYFSVTWVGFTFIFCLASLIKQHFGIWNSVYLQLLQYFILLLLPLQWLCTLVANASDWGKKKYVQFWGKFMLIFTLVSYIVSTYGGWMTLVFICMNYG